MTSDDILGALFIVCVAAAYCFDRWMNWKERNHERHD